MQNLNMQKSKSISNQQILKKYINARAELIQAFCDKQEFESCQVNQDSLIEVAGMYLDLKDIIIDIIYCAPVGEIITWYYYNLDLYESTK